MMPVSVAYDTLDNAAVAAEQSCEDMSWHSGYEFGGVLLERDGKFYYSIAQTSRNDVHIDIRFSFTTDYHFVGLYHTHPGNKGEEYTRWFSDADTRAADVHHVPSYIGIQYEHGAVRKYIPGFTRHENGLEGHIALGEVVK